MHDLLVLALIIQLLVVIIRSVGIHGHNSRVGLEVYGREKVGVVALVVRVAVQLLMQLDWSLGLVVVLVEFSVGRRATSVHVAVGL